MKPDVIRDIRHFIHSKGVGRFDCQGFYVPGFASRRMVDCFMELTGEDLHDTVGIGVVMDRRALARVPHKKKLFQVNTRHHNQIDTGGQLTMFALWLIFSIAFRV